MYTLQPDIKCVGVSCEVCTILQSLSYIYDYQCEWKSNYCVCKFDTSKPHLQFVQEITNLLKFGVATHVVQFFFVNRS